MVAITQQEAAERISPAFAGRKGRLLFRLAARVTGIAKVNALHDRVDTAGVPYGSPFAKGLLDDVGVDFQVGNPERLEALPEGPFIVVANHFYGHLDGICLLDLFGRQRPETKVMVNEMLTWIPGLAPSFIAVNPVTDASKGVSDTSINGVRSALLQLREGGPLCLFPSGAVADLKPREHWTLSERDWQDAAIQLIRKARVPIVPVRFFDRNSRFYYALGLIDYRVRFVRLFHEMFNKRGSCPRVGIGAPISVEEQEQYPDLQAFKAFLRSSVYDIPLPETFVKRSELWKSSK
ncbi:MAG: 1-acyl-sn-glycerol-3-phosphate acyltransferase [Bacteroidales bacterium]|nr:1-acyl-sn-glycerol-3-phosphate acyltransferase [Bacteroidales bacterium]